MATSLIDRTRAGVSAFANPEREPTFEEAAERYASLMGWWAGEWQRSSMLSDPRIQSKNVYKNIRQMWRQADAIVALYQQFVYAGDIPTDGEPMPDGTRGAIPIDPQIKQDTAKKNLRNAAYEWLTMVNYRQFMSQRPKFGSILGDCLTELVDDPDRGQVFPKLVYPGFVKYLELDTAGNVRAYSLEWMVEEPERHMFGTRQPAQRYKYRKDVNQQGTWQYRDDKLYAFTPNPYGFVPAIWDRHEMGLGDRGIGALDRTFNQVVELNSVLSHAMDYQQRQFGAPIGVKGTRLSNRNKPVELRPGASTGDPLRDAAEVAQSLGLIPFSDEGDFITIDFDIGKTTEILTFVMQSIIAESPESRYAQQILEMTQITAPGVERALGPIIGRVNDARKNYDTQTIKLIQMAISMLGWRVNVGRFTKPQLLTQRRERYQKFAMYTLDSFGEGLLDFRIPDRPVIPDTIDERIARQILIESLQWEYSLRVAGVPPEELELIVQEREEEAARQARLDEVMTTGVDPDTGEPPIPPDDGA